MPQDEGTPRLLNEKTGVHKCVCCLREIPAEEYFGNDMVCDECAEGEQPKEAEETEQTMKDER